MRRRGILRQQAPTLLRITRNEAAEMNTLSKRQLERIMNKLRRRWLK
jgi:DNA-binding IscR family transcriptional regulator